MFLRAVTVALAFIATPTLQGQAQANASENTRYTIESAPENLIWRIFLQQVFFHEQRALELERSRPTNATPEEMNRFNMRVGALRQRPRQISALRGADFTALQSVANEYGWQMEQWQASAASLAQRSKKGTLTPADRAEAAALWKLRDEIIARAIGQLRTHFGEVRFRELDQRIREHVVPRLGERDQSTVQVLGEGTPK